MTAENALLDTGLRLLILLARLELTDSQRLKALTLCEDITDWSDVTRKAEKLLVLPLAYQHLRSLSPSSITQKGVYEMRCQCLSIIHHNLQIMGEQQRLSREILAPLHIPYMFFKGPSLAKRYYDDPAIRCCRDIDLLVPQQHCLALLDSALQLGYQAYDPEYMSHEITSLQVAIRTKTVMTLISPQGVQIELHKKLDRGGKLYPTEIAMKDRELLSVGGEECWVMPTPELFVYICLHHTRHHWSHLHWLVDLDAIQRHPSFSLDSVYRCAKKQGALTTVEASLDLYHALADDSKRNLTFLGKNANSLLNAFHIAVQGRERDAPINRESPHTPEFSFNWQTTTSHRMSSRVFRWLQCFKPGYEDYQSWPLPARWQWLYYITRPWRVLIKRSSIKVKKKKKIERDQS
ncbi:nucleotidyltransferase family protein [Halomonas nitroreducens]|nr:nucleotidyltransferase family protein [Halomonas nitroreducens]